MPKTSKKKSRHWRQNLQIEEAIQQPNSIMKCLTLPHSLLLLFFMTSQMCEGVQYLREKMTLHNIDAEQGDLFGAQRSCIAISDHFVVIGARLVVFIIKAIPFSGWALSCYRDCPKWGSKRCYILPLYGKQAKLSKSMKFAKNFWFEAREMLAKLLLFSKICVSAGPKSDGL